LLSIAACHLLFSNQFTPAPRKTPVDVREGLTHCHVLDLPLKRSPDLADAPVLIQSWFQLRIAPPLLKLLEALTH
jgi:hypothetical protein